MIFHMLSGLVADVDIESEKYRWMGSARLDFYVSSHLSCSSLLVYAVAHLDVCVLVYPFT